MYSLFGVTTTRRAISIRAQNGRQPQQRGVAWKSKNPNKQGKHKGLPPAEDVGRSPWLPAPSQLEDAQQAAAHRGRRKQGSRATPHQPQKDEQLKLQEQPGTRPAQPQDDTPSPSPAHISTGSSRHPQQQQSIKLSRSPGESSPRARGSQAHLTQRVPQTPGPPTYQQQQQQQGTTHYPAPRRSAAAQGRYLPALPPTPAAALRLAADLANLAGPEVGIRGPRIRGREKPLELRSLRLTAIAGQSEDPWWRWKQWVRQRARRAAAAARSGTSSSSSSSRRMDATGGTGRSRLRLSAMMLDEWTLDLDELEEGVTQDVLQGPMHDMVSQVAHTTWRQLQQLAKHPPRAQRKLQQAQGTSQGMPRAHPIQHSAPPNFRQQQERDSDANPYLAIYKGGGYIAADLEYMLSRMGLSRVLRLQMHLGGAHCILAKRAWRSGKPVDLRQQESAARARGIPLLLTPSLSGRDVLTALRPLLLERGILPDASTGRQMIVVRRQDNPATKALPAAIKQDGSSAGLGNREPCGPVNVPEQELRRMQQEVMDGVLSVCEFIQAVQLQDDSTYK